MPRALNEYDVRVVQAGKRLGLGQVMRGVLRAGHMAAVRHLDGDAALELVVMGEIDPPEAALTEDALDLVTANGGGMFWSLIA